MRISEGVEWAVHCVVLLAGLPDGAALPATKLAEYHGVPGPYLAKSLQALTRAGLVVSRQGRRGGYLLGRDPAEISLLEIVLAVEGEEPMFRCTEIRQRGPSAVDPPSYPPICGIAAAMERAEEAWRAELARTTVADIGTIVMRQAPRRALAKSGAWLSDVLAR